MYMFWHTLQLLTAFLEHYAHACVLFSICLYIQVNNFMYIYKPYTHIHIHTHFGIVYSSFSQSIHGIYTYPELNLFLYMYENIVLTR